MSQVSAVGQTAGFVVDEDRRLYPPDMPPRRWDLPSSRSAWLPEGEAPSRE